MSKQTWKRPYVLSEKQMALLALAFLVPAPALGALSAMWWFPGMTGNVVYGFFKVWIIVFPVAWWVGMEKRTWFDPLKTSRTGIKAGVLSGLAFGLIIAVVIALGAWGNRLPDTGRIRAVAKASGIGTPVSYAMFFVFLSSINALAEEMVWRYFVYRQCVKVFGVRSVAIVLSALLFTIHHAVALAVYLGPGGVLLSCTAIFLSGAAWSLLYERSGSIWPGYISHAITDAAVAIAGAILIFG